MTHDDLVKVLEALEPGLLCMVPNDIGYMREEPHMYLGFNYMVSNGELYGKFFVPAFKKTIYIGEDPISSWVWDSRLSLYEFLIRIDWL